MPCFITGCAAGNAQLAADEARAEATKVTRMLCELMEELEGANLLHLHNASDGLLAWWVEHKCVDAERKWQEAKQKKARAIERKLEAYRRKLEEE